MSAFCRCRRIKDRMNLKGYDIIRSIYVRAEVMCFLAARFLEPNDMVVIKTPSADLSDDHLILKISCWKIWIAQRVSIRCGQSHRTKTAGSLTLVTEYIDGQSLAAMDDRQTKTHAGTIRDIKSRKSPNGLQAFPHRKAMNFIKNIFALQNSW